MNEKEINSVYQELNKLYIYLSKELSSNNESNDKQINETKDNKNKLILLVSYIKNSIDAFVLLKTEKKVNEYISKQNETEKQQKYEPLLQKYESQLREHIKIEQELKLIVETLQEENEEYDRLMKKIKEEKKDLKEIKNIKELKSENNSLKQNLQFYKEQNLNLTQSEKILKNKVFLKEKEILAMENKYKEEIKILKDKIKSLENKNNETINKGTISNNTTEHNNNYKKIPPPTLNSLSSTFDHKGFFNKSNSSSFRSLGNTRSASANRSYNNINNMSNSNRTNNNISNISNITINKKTIRNLSTGNRQSRGVNYNKKYCHSVNTKNNKPQTKEDIKFNSFLKDFYSEIEQNKNKKNNVRNRNTGQIRTIKGGKINKESSNKTIIINESSKMSKYRSNKYSTINQSSTGNKSTFEITNQNKYSSTIRQDNNSYLRNHNRSMNRTNSKNKKPILNRSASNFGERRLLRSSSTRQYSSQKRK
ncbi:MAG: hypothetical protein MJ252_14615 [archaeon]|nr:hypothetical protein [archaeon]